MAESIIDVPIGEVTKQLTMTVRLTGYRGWHARMTFAIWLMRLAARIAGMGLEVKG